MSQKQKAEATVEVLSKDPEKKDEDDKKKGDSALSGSDPCLEPPAKKKPKKDENELSAEDEELKQRLDELVTAILDTDYETVAKTGLSMLKNEIRSATASMTSVPKPLKFLKAHYDNIKKFYTEQITPTQPSYGAYSDLMSVLAMTMEDPQTRLCLKYRLRTDIDTMTEWGTQYLKHLAAEIRIEMENRLAAEDDPEKTAGLIFIDFISFSENISNCFWCRGFLEIS